MSALQQEMKSRQDASVGSGHDVSLILQTLLKEGALRTNIPKLSAFSGGKGQREGIIWTVELWAPNPQEVLQWLCIEGREYSTPWEGLPQILSIIWEPNVPLDMIIKKFTIVYGNVKSFDLLMRDFYQADQGDEKTIPSFATRIEGLLSQIREQVPRPAPPPGGTKAPEGSSVPW